MIEAISQEERAAFESVWLAAYDEDRAGNLFESDAFTAVELELGPFKNEPPTVPVIAPRTVRGRPRAAHRTTKRTSTALAEGADADPPSSHDPLDGGMPPFVAGSDTSEGAAASIAEVAGRLRRMVLQVIGDAGRRGLTCDETEVLAGLRHQTASARINELARRGLVVDSGARRKTRSRRPAIVWIAKGAV